MHFLPHIFMMIFSSILLEILVVFFLLYVIQKMIYLAVSLQRLLKKKGRNAMVLLPLDRVLDIPRLSPIADNREKGDHKNAF